MTEARPSRLRWPPGALVPAALLFSVSSLGGGLSLPWQEDQRIQGREVVPGDNFGNSVSIAGDVAIVGARGDLFSPGAAWVFRDVDGNWMEEQKLTASDGVVDDRFGISVAIEGDTAVVGAYLAEIDGMNHQGAAYVFERVGGMWVEQQKLTASDGLKQDLFGSAVALRGATLMVSAPGDDIGPNDDQGSVYVFGRTGDLWLEQQKVIISTGQQSDLFGRDGIEIDRGRAVVGARSATVDGVVNKGAAYILVEEAAVWLEEARLSPAGVDIGIGFGGSVSLHDSRVVAGATGETVTHEAQGTAYIFNRIGGIWTEGQRLVASDASEFAMFGQSCATEGGRVLVGGTFDTPGNPLRGAVYSFRWNGSSWVEEQRITPSDSSGLDDFSEAVAIDQDRPLVGGSGSAGGGAAYIFRRATLFADGFESGDTSAWSLTVP